MTKKLLAFAMKGMTQNIPNDIHLLLKESGDLFSRTINKKINLILNLDAEECIVEGDSSQLENAFLNLGINADDAMDGGGDLTISSSNITYRESVKIDDTDLCPPGKYISVKFTDTGSGMSEEVKKHIFEPFYSTKWQKGTGLGLAAVYGTIKSHGGVISVESEKWKDIDLVILDIMMPEMNGKDTYF